MKQEEQASLCYLLELPFLAGAKGGLGVIILCTHSFPPKPRKLEARPWSSRILITAISSSIKPYTPNGWDQTYLQLPKYSFRQYLCTHFQEGIQPGPSQQQKEATMYGKKQSLSLGWIPNSLLSSVISDYPEREVPKCGVCWVLWLGQKPYITSLQKQTTKTSFVLKILSRWEGLKISSGVRYKGSWSAEIL